MSRYNITMKISEQDHNVSYGHDHATGYFVQIYAPQNDTPIVEYDDLFGWNVNRRATSEQHEAATNLLKDIKDETIFTERMDRDPENHLGAKIAAALMQTRGNA
jgi:hypothetical protein